MTDTNKRNWEDGFDKEFELLYTEQCMGSDMRLIKAFIRKVEDEAVARERERITEILTKKINPNEMLKGWERYWKDMGDGNFIECCYECENSNRISEALSQDITSDNTTK